MPRNLEKPAYDEKRLEELCEIGRIEPDDRLARDHLAGMIAENVDVRRLSAMAGNIHQHQLDMQRVCANALGAASRIAALAAKIADHPTVAGNPEMQSLRAALAVEMVRRF